MAFDIIITERKVWKRKADRYRVQIKSSGHNGEPREMRERRMTARRHSELQVGVWQ